MSSDVTISYYLLVLKLTVYLNPTRAKEAILLQIHVMSVELMTWRVIQPLGDHPPKTVPLFERNKKDIQNMREVNGEDKSNHSKRKCIKR